MPTQLTVAEIIQATGKTQPAAQIRHLRRMGIRAERSHNTDSPVLVMRAWLALPPPVSAESRPKLNSDTRGNHGQAAQV